MEQELKAFRELVANADKKFNKITGRLLAHLLEPIAKQIDALCEDEVDAAISLRNTSAFLGKKGASAELSQDAAELLLELQPKPVVAKPADAKTQTDTPKSN